MKNTSLNFFAMLAIFAICSCNKNSTCNTSYTVSGTLLDGKTGRPITDSGTSVYLNAGDPNYSIPGFSINAYPDKNGKFSMTYTNCDDNGLSVTFGVYVPHKNYALFNPYDSFGTSIPLQQNITRTWTAATNGWVVIYLQPLSPLLPGDTLLIQAFWGFSTQAQYYAFTTTQSGVLDSVYLPVVGFSIKWGRGKKNALSNVLGGGVLGDPYISRYTIKY